VGREHRSGVEEGWVDVGGLPVDPDERAELAPVRAERKPDD
jgi:hypothetical protein